MSLSQVVRGDGSAADVKTESGRQLVWIGKIYWSMLYLILGCRAIIQALGFIPCDIIKPYLRNELYFPDSFLVRAILDAATAPFATAANSNAANK